MSSHPRHPVVALLCVLAASCAAAAAQQTPPTVPTGRPPYRILAVTVVNGPSSIAGTLTVPEGPGPFPAVVLLPGASRNQDATIADQLTRRGIVVHRHDNPVVADTVADVLAVVTHLKGIEAIDARRIGLVGQPPHPSPAVRAAPRAGAAFVVIVGAPATSEPTIRSLTIPVLEAPASVPMADVAAWILKTPPR
jgi:dienelactone hydrolase